MKKVLAGIAVLLIISAGALAFAHGPGRPGGHMMGPGYGTWMSGPGYGGMFMGMRARGGVSDQKFLDETVDLRKELHNKKFEYFEASRDPKTTLETLSNLRKEIYDIKSQIREKAPRMADGNLSAYGGRCW
ncbi:MAG: hypothetical protein AB1499_04750 [Nitrospirota bacterium]